MAVNDTTILIMIGIIFNYLVVYKKSEFFGNIGFMTISIAAWYYGTGDVEKIIGMIMFFGSIVNMIYDLLKD